MKPKEKALELSIKMCSPLDVFKPNLASNRKAIIAVDEIIEVIQYMAESDESDKLLFWNKVKLEIEKL